MRLSVVIFVVGGVISLMGLVWFLQGIGVLPGSVMTGSQFWAMAGVFAMIVGLLVIVLGLIRSRGKR